MVFRRTLVGHLEDSHTKVILPASPEPLDPVEPVFPLLLGVTPLGVFPVERRPPPTGATFKGFRSVPSTPSGSVIGSKSQAQVASLSRQAQMSGILTGKRTTACMHAQKRRKPCTHAQTATRMHPFAASCIASIHGGLQLSPGKTGDFRMDPGFFWTVFGVVERNSDPTSEYTSSPRIVVSASWAASLYCEAPKLAELDAHATNNEAAVALSLSRDKKRAGKALTVAGPWRRAHKRGPTWSFHFVAAPAVAISNRQILSIDHAMSCRHAQTQR